MSSDESAPSRKKTFKTRNLPEELEDRTSRLREWFHNVTASRVEVWRYHPTLSMLGLRVTDQTNARELYLWFGGCHFIQSPSIWQNPQLKLSLLNAPNAWFLLEDREANFHVECYAFDLNPERWWFFDNVDYNFPPKKLNKEEAAEYKRTNSSFWEELQHRRIDIDSRSQSPHEVISFIENWMSRFERYQVNIWSFRQSSQLFELRLHAIGAEENLHILCEGCRFFKVLRQSDLTTSTGLEVAAPTQENPLWVLNNQQINLRVEGDIIKATTNVLPLWSIRR